MDTTQYEYKNHPNRRIKNSRPSSAQNSKYAGTSFSSQPQTRNDIDARYELNLTNGSDSMPRPPHQRPSSAVSKRLDQGLRGTRMHTFMAEDSREYRRTFVNDQTNTEYTQPDVHKMVPKKISLEKERLYEDTLHLKKSINQLTDENMKIKSKNQQLEQENAKLSKILEGLSGHGTMNVFGPKASEGSLKITLKKQVRELRDALAKKDEELENYKRNTKTTKLQELETELEVFTDENIRMKETIDRLMRERPQITAEQVAKLEDRLYMQETLIDTLRKDNETLATNLRALELQNIQLVQDNERDIKEMKKKLAELNRVRKQLRDKEKQITKMALDHGITLRNRGVKAEKSEHYEEIRAVLSQKDALIEKLEKIVSGYEAANVNKGRQRPQSASRGDQDQFKRAYEELEIKYRALLAHQNGGDNRVSNQANDNQYPQRIEERTEEDYVSEENEGKERLVSKLHFDDVRDLGYELTLKLRLRKVPIEHAETALLPSKIAKKGYVTLMELKNQLSEEPFTVYEDEEALLIARFLVENSQQETYTLDMDRSADVNYIKKVFRKFLGQYHIIDPESERELISDLANIIQTYEESLKAQLSSLKEAKTGFLSAPVVVNGFKSLDIDISSAHMDYLIMRLYDFTGNLGKLDYLKMFEIFESEEHKKLKKMFEDYTNQDNRKLDERTDSQDEYELDQYKEDDEDMAEDVPEDIE